MIYALLALSLIGIALQVYRLRTRRKTSIIGETQIIVSNTPNYLFEVDTEIRLGNERFVIKTIEGNTITVAPIDKTFAK